jgi:hypothetical protein
VERRVGAAAQRARVGEQHPRARHDGRDVGLRVAGAVQARQRGGCGAGETDRRAARRVGEAGRGGRGEGDFLRGDIGNGLVLFT